MGSRITSLRDGYVSPFLRGTREIEGARKVELVCVGGLWRMGGECLLMPVWRSVRVGFIGKGELDAWAFKAVTWRPENLHRMGGEWAGIGGNYTKSICPVHLVDGYG